MPDVTRRRHLALYAALSVITVSGIASTPAAAAGRAAADTVVAGPHPARLAPAAAAGGYVRLAHLSPDTPDVDVYLSPANDASAPQRFPGVGYGAVSGYLRLPVGLYSVSMRVAGADPKSPPVLTTRVGVQEGRAYTVAGVGRYAGLGLKILEDDLSLPAAGKVKIRIVQASVKAANLDVSVAGGEVVGARVPFASTTPYRLVSPGRWTLNVGPSGASSTTRLAADVTAGNVYSLLVLDGPAGLKAELRLDAGRHGAVPSGGVDTGAGAATAGLAADASAPTVARSGLPAAAGWLAIALAASGLGLLAVRRRPRRDGSR